MKRNRILLFALLVLLVIGTGVLFLSRPAQKEPNAIDSASVLPTAGATPTPKSTLPPPVDPQLATSGGEVKNEPDLNAIQAFAKALLKPISFVGKVVDENGSPIADATITWGANNNPNPHQSGTRGNAQSDAAGFFSIQSHGISLYVKVSKTGYFNVPSEIGGKRGSDGGFSNSEVRGNTDYPMGTQDDPAVFVLRKMGEAAALKRNEGSINLPKNGAPVMINLQSGKESGEGGVKIECWVQDQGVDTSVYNPYDWRCVISVPAGGLIDRTDDLNFMAPDDGYRLTDEIVMTKATPRWDSGVRKEYFIKQADGTFGRVIILIATGVSNFVRFESYLNPKTGDRNLQYDPNQPAAAGN